MNPKNGKIGIAFIRGVSMFGSHNLSKDQLRRILKNIERKHSKSVKFLSIYDNDTIVFSKTGVHYATVRRWIEDALLEQLGEKLFVTTRSLEKVKKVVDKFGVRG